MDRLGDADRKLRFASPGALPSDKRCCEQLKSFAKGHWVTSLKLPSYGARA